MIFESDEQRKAVMATLYYSGKLYDRSYFDGNYFDSSDWSHYIYDYNSKLLNTEFEKTRKRLEQERKELNSKEIEKKIKGILFKFKGEFSNQKNMQQFCHTVVKLNTSFENVFWTLLNS